MVKLNTIRFSDLYITPEKTFFVPDGRTENGLAIIKPEDMDVFYTLLEETWDGDILTDKTFDTLDVWNEYQRGTLALNSIQCKPSPLKKKFRI